MKSSENRVRFARFSSYKGSRGFLLKKIPAILEASSFFCGFGFTKLKIAESHSSWYEGVFVSLIIL